MGAGRPGGREGRGAGGVGRGRGRGPVGPWTLLFLSQVRDKRLAFVRRVMNLLFQQNVGFLLAR
jgi:hypothetical protein